MTADALEHLAALLRDATGFARFDNPALATRLTDAAAAVVLARRERADERSDHPPRRCPSVGPKRVGHYDLWSPPCCTVRTDRDGRIFRSSRAGCRQRC